MSDIAIEVENLGKRYRIGTEEEQHETLFGAATSWLKSPLQNFRSLKRLSAFNEDDDSEDLLWALRDVSFRVDQGQVVGLIGPNGAGKSTLLKILSRITEPSHGRARIDGRVASLLEVGTGFHSELTGRENVFLNGTVLGMTRAEVDRKFDEIVAFSGIERFIDTPVKRYSSGMKVRLAFAVAAHLDPEILLIDEVLAVGDFAFQQKCLGKMGEVASSGRTVLFVSHQMDMVRSLCERCILLERGRISLRGEPDNVIGEYLERGYSADDSTSHFENHGSEDTPIHLRSGRILDEYGEECTLFDVFDPIILELEYEVRAPVDGGILYIDLKRGGATLFQSFDTDEAPARLEARKSGIHKYRLRLPSPLLRAGCYTLDVGAGIANQRKISHIEDALSFEVRLESRPSTFLSYADKRPGSIVTTVDWQEV